VFDLTSGASGRRPSGGSIFEKVKKEDPATEFVFEDVGNCRRFPPPALLARKGKGQD
jgi:hypothetical protein